MSYNVDKESELLDYDAILAQAKEVRPKLIVAGASAYSRIIDFAKFREIADAVGAYLMVDMAHIAGLVASGHHPSPVPYAHVTTTTTHKTLRGPRGGLILTDDEDIAKKLNSAVFPGLQGGPLEHVIAAKAVALKEALDPAFKEYGETSGIRVGSPAITSRGMGEAESRQIAEWMVEALENHDKPEVLERIRGDVKVLTDAFPLY